MVTLPLDGFTGTLERLRLLPFGLPACLRADALGNARRLIENGARLVADLLQLTLIFGAVLRRCFVLLPSLVQVAADPLPPLVQYPQDRAVQNAVEQEQEGSES